MVDPTLAEMGKNLNEAMKMLEDNERCVQRIINVAVVKQERIHFHSSVTSAVTLKLTPIQIATVSHMKGF